MNNELAWRPVRHVKEEVFRKYIHLIGIRTTILIKISMSSWKEIMRRIATSRPTFTPYWTVYFPFSLTSMPTKKETVLIMDLPPQGAFLPSCACSQVHSKGKNFRAGTVRWRTWELVLVCGTTTCPLPSPFFLWYITNWQVSRCEVWRHHDGEYKDDCLLDSCAA
jgi:hypothetical protein